ncbi:sugar transferase [Hymenobacter negativus]|uniref:Sugar transferase n=1 Tax=Hymenobacter negativus TaxID=2795026 RepID=A0ABS3QLB1_9BACT|nr:sugar transferase [Hymenobacter negativus]MBO2011470.1 sugar transferase [Hymenobacter negativus]
MLSNPDRSIVLTSAQQRYLVYKNLYDVGLALVVLVLCAPLLLVLMAWVKLDSRGGVFYLQKRPGRNNRLFTLIKFRSMTVPEEGDAFLLTQANDARLTTAGKWLRKLHMDELPQLINVLLGHMSLVGPRPLPEPLYAAYQQAIPDYNLRHVIKPGITGFAQIWQGYTNTMEEETLKWKYDMYYIQRISLKNDLMILRETIFGKRSRNIAEREAQRKIVIANNSPEITAQSQRIKITALG